MPKPRRTTSIVLAMGALCTACALALLLWVLNMRSAATAPSPSPNTESAASTVTTTSTSESAENASVWADVDWDYWRAINPDIVAWIQIVGTDISYPIVQASADNPDYYLKHDVYGNWNPWGAIYLDAECAEGGLLDSANAVIYGHNMSDGTMFSVVPQYSSYSWASEHRTVLIQTPDARVVYYARFANIVNNATNSKITSFASLASQLSWYEDQLSSAAMVLDADTRPANVISLVTCSYNYWADERTVVTCSADESDSLVDLIEDQELTP